MEFFFDRTTTRFVHAVEYMTRIVKDKKRGRPHSIRTNIKLCSRLRLPDPILWWGRTLAFDALIGNTDRHPENWGFTIGRPGARGQAFEFAPAFDNGTSLGYEISDDALQRRSSPERVRRFVDKGLHHCGWDITEDSRGPHIAMCKQYCAEFPEARDAMKQVIQYDPNRLSEILNLCASFDVGVAFSPERVRFVMALVETRRSLLTAAFGGEQQ
ncbi:MAG: hypothetical protein FJX54_20200 [Alphaproteobacteria bacterium]|nr:hypothetical protein [Alphaproteobacteria bacterium]